MRIIAGEYSSRKIVTPKGMQTRPTLDKVREAVFSSLGGFFDGGYFLDLYGGSGANALEAISRGMEYAVIVDVDRNAIEAINQNIESLQVKDKTKVFRMKETHALKVCREEGYKFSLIYLDPPYAKQKNVEIIKTILDYDLLEDGGRIVVESSKEDSYPEEIESLHMIKESTYGMTKITYYKKEV